MKIIDRYISSNVLFSTIFGVVVLSLVLVLGNIFKELLDLIINRDVPLQSVILFMLYVLPFSLTFTIPWGFLTAVLLVFGRLSADNELIALRSNGVSIQRISGPVLLLGAALTGLCLFINLEVAPRAEQEMSKTLFRIATSNPLSLFATDEVITEFPGRRIFIGSKENERLQNVFLFELDEKFYPVKVVHAHEGEINFDETNSRLLMRLFGATFEQRDADDPGDLNKMRRGIVMREGVFPIDLLSLYDEHSKEKRLSAHTAGELISLIQAGNLGDRALATHVELSRRFSTSLACFAFALIAIPLGITAHRRETSVGFGLSLVIAFAYFFFIIMAETFKNQPAMYPVGLVWAPNIIFLSLGGWLFYRLMKQ